MYVYRIPNISHSAVVHTLGGGLHKCIQYKTSIRTLVNHPLEGRVFLNGRGLPQIFGCNDLKDSHIASDDVTTPACVEQWAGALSRCFLSGLCRPKNKYK